MISWNEWDVILVLINVLACFFMWLMTQWSDGLSYVYWYLSVGQVEPLIHIIVQFIWWSCDLCEKVCISECDFFDFELCDWYFFQSNYFSTYVLYCFWLGIWVTIAVFLLIAYLKHLQHKLKLEVYFETTCILKYLDTFRVINFSNTLRVSMCGG